tara:strand:+ start:3832 stop:4650 length:819 start_codon:yes stop_codon:yes gene_type:complete
LQQLENRDAAMTLEIITESSPADNGRPHLVFVPGSFHGAWCWQEHYLPYFSQNGWHSHAVSLRDHDSQGPKTGMPDWSLADYTSDVNNFIASLDRQVVLIGHSMGGVIAQMSFVDNARVVGLVPFASSPLRPARSVIFRLLRQHPIAFLGGQLLKRPNLLRKAMESFFFSDSLDAALLRVYQKQLTGESQKALDEVFTRDKPQISTQENRPVLVIAGRNDWSIPIADHKWLAEVYRAELAVCDGAHDIMLDPQWKDSADTLRVWLEHQFGKI